MQTAHSGASVLPPTTIATDVVPQGDSPPPDGNLAASTARSSPRPDASDLYSDEGAALRNGNDSVGGSGRDVGSRLPLGMRPDTYLFFQLFVSIFVAIANGSIFCFSLFSPALQRPPFSFSTRDTNVVSTVGVITSYFSLPTGQIYDRTSPRVTLALGTTINIVGWLLMFGIFSGHLSQSLASVAVCYSITQLAATFFETGSVLPNLDAFALHEGRIVMIQKTFMGLGTSVIAAIFNAFFLEVDIRWFFLVLCALAGVVGGSGAWLIRRPQVSPEWVCRGLNVDKTFRGAYGRAFGYCLVVLVANVAFLFIIDIVGAFQTVSAAARVSFGYIAIILTAAFFPSMALLPRRRASRSSTTTTAQSGGCGSAGEGGEDPHGASSAAELYEAKPAAARGELNTFNNAADDGGGDGHDDDAAAASVRRNVHGLLKNVRRPELWLLWFVSFGTWGAMALVNSNSAQIYKAIVGPAHYDDSENTVMVSLFGIGSALGRICVGFAKGKMGGRDIWFVAPVAPILMVAALPLLLVVGGGPALRLPFFLIGYATGVAWGGTVLIIKRLFTEAGRHYSFLYTAGMLTPLFFNLWLFSGYYEAESRRQRQPSLSDCDGVACLTVPLGVATAMNVVAAPMAFLFAWRIDSGRIFD